MAKHLNRLKAHIARNVLRESAKESKNWIVSKKLILETDEGDMEFEKGDVVEIGNADGDMAIKGSAAVVIISDEDLASKIADIVVSSDELSDVNFVQKPALDAVLDGEEVDTVIDKLADEEPTTDEVEVAELDVENKESVASKFAKFSENRIDASRALVCESILVDEADEAPINMAVIKADRVARETITEHTKFAARVSELGGSIQPGVREIALNEASKVIGAFNKETNLGILFTETAFEDVEEMDNFSTEPEALMQDVDLGVESVVEVEESLKAFDESAKSGKDYIKLVESLSSDKIGLKEEVIAKIASTLDNRSLTECVRVYDSKFGKYVAAFKETVDADNFIAETEEVKRFTRRHFA